MDGRKSIVGDHVIESIRMHLELVVQDHDEENGKELERVRRTFETQVAKLQTEIVSKTIRIQSLEKKLEGRKLCANRFPMY